MCSSDLLPADGQAQHRAGAGSCQVFVAGEPARVGGHCVTSRKGTGFVNVTAIGAPWTVGTVSVGTLTQMGFAHGPASLTSSTAAASGQVRLVTPIFISTNISALPVFPAFGVLDLHFVPEPATLLLLGSGIAGLVMFGRTKRG